jgi:serine phosphatase RsbU (regulator of sigma subunit)/Tfp pilus assembly protein PilF
MKRFLAISFLLIHVFFVSPVSGQNKSVIDSLEQILSSEPTDTLKAIVMAELSVAYLDADRAKSFQYAREAILLSEKINFKRGAGFSHNNLGDLYWFAGDYTNASDHYFKALKIFEELNDSGEIANCYRNIGWIYQGQNNFPLTIKYYKKALEINRAMNNKKRIVANYDDLSIVYKLMKKFDEALDYCQRTIQLASEIGNQKGLGTSYGNLGAIYSAMGNYDLAIESLLKASKLHEQYNDHYNAAECYVSLANAYLQTRKHDKAIEYAEKAVKIARENNFKTVLSDASQRMAFAYAAKKDFLNAYDHLAVYADLQDSTYNENNSKHINEMSAKYESEKKELMISSLEKDNALSAEKLEKEKNFKIYLLIFCLMIAAFAFFLYRGNIQKKKANSALSEAYEEIELKNKDITDSISYSKRIQDACLPSDELRKELFPDSFILFKPKDIVSGDFYWYAEKDGKKLIAACDCTGHGVPGALMSMIGNNILNQIVNEKGITSAAEILNHLHSDVRKSLKQEEHPENRDGMDIALLIFKNNEVEFSAAQRPLWLVRNNSLTEIKGTKSSIGGMQTEETRSFESHTFQLEKGDLLYLFSDGYADQFGGASGKKFMTKNMKQLILGVHKSSMKEQLRILDTTIEAWKDKNEQVDDILVIGIKTE